MEQIINNIHLLISSIFVAIAFFIIWKIYNFIIRVIHVKNFADYISVLEYHMNKAYELIHKDRILIYSLEATRVPDSDFEAITHDFVKLVLKFLGPSLKEVFIKFFGDENSFIFNMVEYFNTRYEEDAIRKQSMDDISSGEDINTEVPSYEQLGTWCGN